MRGGKCPYQWTSTFFGLPARYRKDLHQEIFTLVYYGQGFSFSDLYTMPVYLRRFYSEALLKEKEQEKKARDKANNASTQMSHQGVPPPSARKRF